MRFNISFVDKNPSTANLSKIIGMIPCNENNLATFLDAFPNHDFYIAIRGNRIFLIIKSRERYVEIPSQNYSPSCWRGFAHPAITLEGLEAHS
jgi:hypothetical protein